MPTTSWGLRYPSSSAVPNVNQDIQNLATDTQAIVLPRYASIAARNAAIPSPVANQACTVNGAVHTYDGSGWRFVLYGSGRQTTDASGQIFISHSAGQSPLAWTAGIRSQDTDQLNTIVKFMTAGESTTQLILRVVRTDTTAYLATTTINYFWWAQF